MTENHEISKPTDQDPGAFARKLDLPPFPEFADDYLPDSVMVHFHFAPHRTAEHFDEAKELLKDADIFVPESTGWTEQVNKDFTAISKGDVKRLARLSQAQAVHGNTGFTVATYESIHGTYKPVVLVDADSSRKDLLMGDASKKYAKAVSGNLETTLQGFADVMAMYAEVSYHRDLIMARNFGPKITELISQHPRLSPKAEVNILMTLGFSHLEFFEALSSTEHFKDRVTSSVWTGVDAVDVESRVVMKYKRGEVPTRQDIEESLLAFALGMTSVPSIDKRPIYDFNNPYLRNPDAYVLAGDIVIKMLQDMGTEGLELALRILRKNVTKSDGQLLLELTRTALDLATEVTTD